ncbi:MAG: co-chaperone GroES [Candidatus Acetothermia bacterium]|jgi:chaperonin GroES|nr:co-chaperone GroES [Candidatus Acetothermia bacterium]MDH7504543.1 co-chaperone GroES [Candidatus Acetothermia bacterium]
MAKKAKLKPLGNRVLVKRLEEEESGGIVLPADVERDEKYIKAEVVEVGTAEKMEVAKGDRVILSSFGGTEIELDGEEYLVVKTTDILAKLE